MANNILGESLAPQRRDAEPYKVMVVDDSAVIRGLSARIIENDPELTVVSSVGNGEQAIAALRRQKIDVIILDIEMPVMDGMTALPKLLEVDPEVRIIMSSTLTLRNADVSLRALAIGAADYVPKPTSTGDIVRGEDFRRDLVAKIKALCAARHGRTVVAGQPRGGQLARAPAKSMPKMYEGAPIALRAPSIVMPRVLVIGSSTGGPNALVAVLSKLDPSFRLPILIAQHMPATFTAMLAEHLRVASGRPTGEGKEGELIQAGHIYVAPGDHHMMVSASNSSMAIHLNKDAAENFCRPSVDPLLRSVVESYGQAVLTLILTGMGQDGLGGSRAVIEAGGTVVAQDAATSVVWGMPGAVASAGLCSAVLPLDKIAAHVCNFGKGARQ